MSDEPPRRRSGDKVTDLAAVSARTADILARLDQLAFTQKMLAAQLQVALMHGKAK